MFMASLTGIAGSLLTFLALLGHAPLLEAIRLPLLHTFILYSLLTPSLSIRAQVTLNRGGNLSLKAGF
jgi:hypothetical protein